MLHINFGKEDQMRVLNSQASITINLSNKFFLHLPSYYIIRTIALW